MSNIDVNKLPSESIVDQTTIDALSKTMADIEMPYIIKDKVLMSEGNWNDNYYSWESILSAFNKTDWTDRNNRDLFLDHEDLRARDWIGEVINPHPEGKFLMGDLHIHDPITAMKFASGNPKVGVSPKVKGTRGINDHVMHDFVFNNFSVVMNPAVKTAYINNMEVEKMSNEPESVQVAAENLKETVKPVPTDIKKVPVEDEKPDELSTFTDFIASHLKSNQGATVKDAAKAWKAQKASDSMADLEKLNGKISALESALEDIKKAKSEKYPEEEKKMSDMKEEIIAEIKKLTAEKAIVDELPERRTAKIPESAPVGADITMQINEMKEDTNKAMASWVKKVADGGRYA